MTTDAISHDSPGPPADGARVLLHGTATVPLKQQVTLDSVFT